MGEFSVINASAGRTGMLQVLGAPLLVGNNDASLMIAEEILPKCSGSFDSLCCACGVGFEVFFFISTDSNGNRRHDN